MEKHEELFTALRKVNRAIDLHSKHLSKTVGLTGPQLVIMQQIGRQKGIHARQIAQNVNLSPATVTSIIDRIEARDLVHRIRSKEDKRRVGLFLTEAGENLLIKAPQPLHDHFIQEFSALAEWEQSQLLSSIQRLAKMMDAQDLDAAPILEVGTLQPTTTQQS